MGLAIPFFTIPVDWAKPAVIHYVMLAQGARSCIFGLLKEHSMNAVGR